MRDLTPREQQVISALAAGKEQKQIASELGISLYTMKAHIANIYSRLGAVNAPNAVYLYDNLSGYIQGGGI